MNVLTLFQSKFTPLLILRYTFSFDTPTHEHAHLHKCKKGVMMGELNYCFACHIIWYECKLKRHQNHFVHFYHLNQLSYFLRALKLAKMKTIENESRTRTENKSFDTKETRKPWFNDFHAIVNLLFTYLVVWTTT